jgi:ABC-type uncharacterized transport system substrate-binding protein
MSTRFCGTKPGNIPVEQPTKFDLIFNLTTAKALGLAIPERSLLPPMSLSIKDAFCCTAYVG